MKKQNIFKALMPIIGVTLAVFAALILNSVFMAAGVIAAVGTAVVDAPVSMEAVQGAGDLNLDHVDKMVQKMMPAATPIDTIMRDVPSKKIPAMKTSYYAVDARAMKDTLSAAYTAANATTATITPTTIGMWNEDDTVLFVGIDGSDSDDLVGFITAVSSTQITVQPINGSLGTGANEEEMIVPSIASGTVLVRMGNAKNELDAQTDPYGLIPDDSYNYCQYFMAQTEVGVLQAQHQQEAEWDFSDQEELNIYDMRAAIERSTLFGYKAYLTDKKASNPKKRYFTGGISREITTALTYGTGGTNRTVTEADFITWAKAIFTGNSGSETRFMFMGDGVTAYISQIDTVSKQIAAGKTFTKWGITFNEIETNFGRLMLKYHPGFTQSGWSDKAMVLDINNVQKRSFVPTRVKELDLKSAGIRNVNASITEEASCLVLKYPETHAIISPKA